MRCPDGDLSRPVSWTVYRSTHHDFDPSVGRQVRRRCPLEVVGAVRNDVRKRERRDVREIPIRHGFSCRPELGVKAGVSLLQDFRTC